MVNELKETVEEDDIEIRKLIKNQQDTFENHVNDEFNDLKEKVEDQGLKDTDLKSAIDDLKVVYEEDQTNLKKLIKEQSEFTGKSLSEALLFADHEENMLCTKNVFFLVSTFRTT